VTVWCAGLDGTSGQSIVSIRHLVYVTVCRWPCGVQVWMEYQESQLYQYDLWYMSLYVVPAKPAYHTVTYIEWRITRGRIDTIYSPDDEHLVARNMEGIRTKKYKKKELCAKLFIYKDCNKMHGKQNMKFCLNNIKKKLLSLLQKDTSLLNFFLFIVWWNLCAI